MKLFKSVPALAIAVFIFTRLIILFAFDEYVSDVRLYYLIANTVIDKGGLPYRDVLFGYPPLSLSTIYLPYFLSKNYDAYRLAYQLTNVVFDFICFVYVGKFLTERLALESKRVTSALIIYSFLGLCYAHIIYDRVDIFIVLCFVAALYYATREPIPRLMVALTWCSIGILWKLIPIFWMPILVSLKGRREGFKGFVIGTLYALIPSMAIMWAYDVWNDGILTQGLTLHSDRGIQVESLWATPFMIWRSLDKWAPITSKFMYGAIHLTGGGLPDIYVSISKYIGFFVIAFFYLICLRSKRKFDVPFIFFMLSMPLLLFILTQRVLSTTFMIWLIPIFTIFWAMRPRAMALVLPFAIGVLTYVGFDVGYGPYIEFDPRFGAVFLLRNILLVIYTAYFAHALIQQAPRPASEAASSGR